MITKMTLNRVAHHMEYGTFGTLKIDEVPFAVTLELPWQNNTPNISCIPAGEYNCCRVQRKNGTWTFRVMNVPDRNDILFHIANTVKDLKGCIGIAEEFGVLNGKPAVLASGRGYAEFMEKLHGTNKFILEIC